jgi:hypothetical protein
MNRSLTRRKFILAASSLGSLIMTHPLNVFAQKTGEGLEVLRPHDKHAG